MPLSMFNALPTWFGGKRRLRGEIFKLIPPPTEAPTLIDAFLGGGAISLYAKARGYRVVCNDIAERSHIVGQALIANDRVKLADEDVVRLFVEEGTPDSGAAAVPGFVEEHYCPDVFTTKHARFLDRALANVASTTGTKRWLLLLLILKYLFRMRPMGNFGAKTIVHQMEDGRWEDMKPLTTLGALARRINGHPRRNAEAIRQQINSGIFANGHENEVHRSDVLDFLPQARGDVVYFDPPYYGTLAYESALKVVDNILRGEVREPERSAFSQRGAFEVIEQMFAAAQHIPVWVMSFGNARTELEDLAALMRKFRSRVDARALVYTHLASLASQESRERNQEFLLVGTGAR